MQTTAKQIPYRLPIAHSKPKNGLLFVCATVGTERFSFYLLSSVLVLYLNEQIGFSAARSVQVFGFFLCAAYLAPFLGGSLCDGKVGCRQTALWGSVLQIAGYFALLSDRLVSLVVALGLLSVGSGLFKAGTQVGTGS
jgi:proton-dependent oligopeptide transporter, POT family